MVLSIEIGNTEVEAVGVVEEIDRAPDKFAVVVVDLRSDVMLRGGHESQLLVECSEPEPWAQQLGLICCDIPLRNENIRPLRLLLALRVLGNGGNMLVHSHKRQELVLRENVRDFLICFIR